MSQAVQIFNNPEFGDVRIVELEGKIFFVGRDVAVALGYSNPNDALAKHVPDKYKRLLQVEMAGQMRNVTFITEAGLYKLVMRSSLPVAEHFTDLLCETILPNLVADEIKKLLKEIFTTRKSDRVTECNTHVYILLMENQKVKIGISGNMKNRIRSISTASGLKVLNRWQTATAIPRKKALEIERRLHEKFAANRTRGEFFDIDFNEACEEAERDDGMPNLL